MFLTLEDPNARIKGSRDPLGVQPIWSSFARHVVTNLTSVTGSLRGFTVLLLGRYVVARLIDEERLPREEALDAFLRFEQVAAYARFAGHGVENDIRGIERVKRHHAEGRGRVNIGANRDGYILSDQKVYGLWGLFSVSSRVSGLIPDGPTGIEPAALEFVERHYLPTLEDAWKPLSRLIGEGGRLDTRGGDTCFEAVKRLLPDTVTPDEASFYGEYLRDGLHVQGRAPGRQRRFAALLDANTDLSEPASEPEIRALIKAAAKEDSELARRLERILELESVIAPAAVLFDHTLTQHGRRGADVAADLTKRWGKGVSRIDPSATSGLLPEIAQAAGDQVSRFLFRTAEALAGGNYEAAIDAVLEWNAAVMRAREGAPWVRREGERLDVRYRGAEQLLPDRKQLATLWRNGYFIASLKRITHQVKQVAG